MALDNVKNILLVLSGKGGVGKSSITTQLALSLCLAGYSVGILDIDLTGPSIPRFLGIESSKIKQAPGGWLPVEVHTLQTLPPVLTPLEQTAPSVQNGATTTSAAHESVSTAPPSATAAPPHTDPIGSLCAMSLAFLLASRSSAIVWRGPKKTAMVRQFLSDVLWPPLDYLLIDTPPGTSDEHISVIETLLKKVHNPSAPAASAEERVYPSLAGAVVVTTPQAVALSDVRKEINFCAKTGVRIVGVVENMSGYVCPCCGVASNIFSKGGGQVMAEEFGVPFLGGVPIDALWGQLVEEGVRPAYGGENLNQEKEEEDADGTKEEEAEVNRVDEDQEGNNTEEDIKTKKPRDEALLVDKYRSCSLYPVFHDITREIVERVQNGTAVIVKSPSVV